MTPTAGPVTVSSLARTYVRCNAVSKAAGAPFLPLDSRFVNLLQSSLFMYTAHMGRRLWSQVLMTLYAEERFPDQISENRRIRTLLGLLGYAAFLAFCIVFRV